MAKKTTPRLRAVVPAAAPVVEPEQREAMIRERAHELFLHRGSAEGHAMEDWLEAEREVDERLRQPLAA